MHGIEVIELGGEKRTIAINMHCLMFLGKVLKCDPDQIDKKIMEACEVNQLRGVTFVIYAGLLGYLETQCIYDHDITLQKVSTWVGEADINSFTSIWTAFVEAMGLPKATQEQIDEYVKARDQKSGSKKKNLQPQ